MCRYLCACACNCVKVVSAVDNNIESSVLKTRKLRSILLPSQIYVNVKKMTSPPYVCNCLMADLHSSQEVRQCPFSKMDIETVSVLPFCPSLCTRSFLLHVFLHHIINSVTVCSKGPCLMVHIQSCRLKQIAICMPLGEKKQREAPFLIPSLHLTEYSLCKAPNLCFSPPSCCDRQSNHSNQCFLVPSRLGSSCQNKRVSVQSL